MKPQLRSQPSPAAGPAGETALFPKARRQRSLAACQLLGLAAFAAAAFATLPAVAAEQGLSISHPWMRIIISARPAAGYFTLSNETAEPVSLVGAVSPACGRVLLHQSQRQGTVEKMAMVKSVTVPPHGKLVFAPGSYHLMCMSPGKAMQPGHTVPMTLNFAGGGTLSADFPVRGATGR